MKQGKLALWSIELNKSPLISRLNCCGSRKTKRWHIIQEIVDFFPHSWQCRYIYDRLHECACLSWAKIVAGPLARCMLCTIILQYCILYRAVQLFHFIQPIRSTFLAISLLYLHRYFGCPMKCIWDNSKRETSISTWH